MDLKEYFLSRKIEYFATLSYSDCRVTNPALIEREGFIPKSVIIYLLPYYVGETENISRYAAALDYHIAIRNVADGLIERLSKEYPGASFKGYGDHSPIDEIHAGIAAGLGILGDNGLLINEKYGSYIFVGDVLTDIEPQLLGAVEPRGLATCIHCGECKRLCPTGILRGEEKSCLSAITQRKGELFNFEVDLMRKVDTVWGCDVCQEHCPYNRNPVTTPIEFFHKELILRLDRDTVDAMDKEALRKRAFGWRGRRVLERNLDCVYAKNK